MKKAMSLILNASIKTNLSNLKDMNSQTAKVKLFYKRVFKEVMSSLMLKSIYENCNFGELKTSQTL